MKVCLNLFLHKIVSRCRIALSAYSEAIKNFNWTIHTFSCVIAAQLSCNFNFPHYKNVLKQSIQWQKLSALWQLQCFFMKFRTKLAFKHLFVSFRTVFKVTFQKYDEEIGEKKSVISFKLFHKFHWILLDYLVVKV